MSDLDPFETHDLDGFYELLDVAVRTTRMFVELLLPGEFAVSHDTRHVVLLRGDFEAMLDPYVMVCSPNAEIVRVIWLALREVLISENNRGLRA